MFRHFISFFKHYVLTCNVPTFIKMKHSLDTMKQYFKLSLNRTSPFEFPLKLYLFETPLNQVYFTLDIFLSLLFIEIHSSNNLSFLIKHFSAFDMSAIFYSVSPFCLTDDGIHFVRRRELIFYLFFSFIFSFL